MRTILSTALKAVIANHKYDELRTGVVANLPQVGPIEFRLTLIQKSNRSPGYCFPECTYRAEVTSSLGVVGYGFGEDSFKLVAIQKAVSEALERAVYKTLKPIQHLQTSNAWACHYNETHAKNSAASELLERDTILRFWLEEKSFHQIKKSDWPKRIRHFENTELRNAKEFTRLHILIPPNTITPVVSVAITNENNNGFISHALDRNFDRATEKALYEVCRIASIFESDELDQSFSNIVVMPTTSWDHAIAYARHRRLPENLFGQFISGPAFNRHWNESIQNFEKQQNMLSFETVNAGAFTVVRAKSENLQDLYFGEGTTRINPRAGITPSALRLREPHIVP